MKSGIILFIVEGPSDYPALMPYIEKKLLSLTMYEFQLKKCTEIF
ncbi:hypothetical protein HMPREF1049_1489 [Fusobacterium necrophorum subsp. funduliforme ATCC 51357]|nr:hypothetical protein [Fusobacterium necrophorum]EIJ71292.1 hypothetical protein HMPREF1049_1489 [Fusobacterium necrophorum subsp. funduliforme ATCC 51357]